MYSDRKISGITDARFRRQIPRKAEKIEFNGNTIEVERGQRITSIDKLAARWKWSRHKVSNYLNCLEEEGMLVQVRDNKKTLISVENYEKYQTQTEGRMGREWDKFGTAVGTPDGTSKNISKSIDNQQIHKIEEFGRDMSRDI